MSNKTIHELDSLSEIAQNDEMLIYDISAGADNPTKKTTAGNILNYVKDDLKEVYSTDEVETNKVWIDGKKIYSKSFIMTTGLSCNANVWTNVKNNFSGLGDTCANIDSLVTVDYTNTYPNNNSPLRQKLTADALVHYPSANDLSLYFFASQNLKVGSLLTIEYTKTTD